jgi:hypothetical protein
MRATFKAFEEDLAGYSPEEIAGAFREWRQSNNQAPLSADILKILNWQPYPLTQTSQEREPENPNDWAGLAERQRAELEDTLDEIKERLGDKRGKIDRGSPDPSHFNSMAKEAQEAVMAMIPESLKNLERAHLAIKTSTGEKP